MRTNCTNICGSTKPKSGSKGTFNKFAVNNTVTSNTITIGDISHFKRIKICDNRNV